MAKAKVDQKEGPWVPTGDQVPAWCLTHDDLAWLYNDGSIGCMYCYVVETSSSECEVRELAPLRWASVSAKVTPEGG